MEKEGYVSLWIGNIKSDDELMAYVELEYTDDGDCIPSKFLKDFSIDIDDIDEDFIERVCHENKVSSISELISGCSYEEIILPKKTVSDSFDFAIKDIAEALFTLEI